MAPSPVLVSSPRRSHQPLSQMKSSMFGNDITANSNNRRSTAPGSPTKRPLYNDENFDPTQNSKRVKSTTHILTKCFSNNTENPKQASPTTKQPSRFILTDRAQPQQRAALGNVTNTHHRVEKSKPRVGSSLKNSVLNASPPRRRPTTPPRSARERRVPFAVRVDPPAELSSYKSASIDTVLRDTTARSRSSSLLTPNADVLPLGGALGGAMPDSWQFTIYEDTPTETLQNMMEHSTNTLDISDDESSKSELGKENIPPIVGQSRMSVDAPSLPSKRSIRQPLREMESSELEETTGSGMPTLEKEAFMTVTTPEKKKPSLAPRAKGALRFSVWSDSAPTKKRSANGGKKRGLSEI